MQLQNRFLSNDEIANICARMKKGIAVSEDRTCTPGPGRRLKRS